MAKPRVTTEKKTQADKLPAAVQLGKLGGQVGGPARAAKLSAQTRSRIARDAALARWRGHRKVKNEDA